MARALWKGSLAFGLVNIPVELHTAVRDSRPRFRLLHARDKSPVRFERVCAREGKRVAWEDLVRGFEYAKGRFVVLTRDDFRQAALEKTRIIDVHRFVKPEDIDDRYFETSYYVVPAREGERAYALLRETLRETSTVGIATVVLREAQHLAAVEVVEEAIVLTLMRYPEELVDVGTFRFPRITDVRKQERAMARTLVEHLTGDWDPSRYGDRYRENLLKIVKAKLKNRDVHLDERVEPRGAEVIDLMERLRQSLEGARGTTAPRPKRGGAGKAKGRGRKKSAAA